MYSSFSPKWCIIFLSAAGFGFRPSFNRVIILPISAFSFFVHHLSESSFKWKSAARFEKRPSFCRVSFFAGSVWSVTIIIIYLYLCSLVVVVGCTEWRGPDTHNMFVRLPRYSRHWRFERTRRYAQTGYCHPSIQFIVYGLPCLFRIDKFARKYTIPRPASPHSRRVPKSVIPIFSWDSPHARLDLFTGLFWSVFNHEWSGEEARRLQKLRITLSIQRESWDILGCRGTLQSGS